jgi:phosphate transport system permease protein
MTDISQGGRPKATQGDWGSVRSNANVARRKRSELMLKMLGLGAISVAFLMLFLMVSSLVSTGYHAFSQTHVTMEFPISAERFDAANPAGANYRAAVQDAMEAALPDMDGEAARKMAGILSNSAQFTLRDRVVADPSLIGGSVTLKVPVSDPYDQLNKGLIDRATLEENRRLSDAEIAAFDALADAGVISKPFNWALFTNADSRFPELAGLKGAIVGSFYALLVCFLLSFPLGIGAAIYLEEFAPKGRVST